MKRKEIFEYLINYIEGRIPNNVFVEFYIKSKKVRKMVCKVANKKHFSCIDEYYISTIKGKFEDYFFALVGLQNSIDRYLTYKKIKHNVLTPELVLFNKWDDIIPSWLEGMPDVYYLLEKHDENKTKTKKYYKEYLASLYKYEKKPPRWLQFAEWPIINDKPCKFIKQTGNPDDLSTDEIYYYFLDETNNQEIVVHQYI